jgi:hypothetical protein
MRIIIRSEDTNLRLRLPTRMLLNPITAAFVPRQVKEHLTYRQRVRLCREIRRARKALNGLPLVDVQSADGSIVQIWV